MDAEKVPVGLQLFSVRGECQKDLPAALRAVADLGYAAAEPWGYSGEALEWMGWPVRDIRKMYDDAGLQSCIHGEMILQGWISSYQM